MDQWQPGTGEIPAQPRDPHVQRPSQAEEATTVYGSPLVTSTPATHNGHRKTRAEVREMRRQEREVGVEFWLPKTEMMVRVRDLPFTDRVMLRGIPADMRTSIERAIEITSRTQGASGISAALTLVDAEADLSDAVGIAGFIWPKLVRTEQSRIMAIQDNDLTDEDVWLVEDLHPDEKAAYRDFVFRDRKDGEKEDTARLASFPDSGLAQAPDRQDRPSGEPVALRSPADGGVGIWAGDATRA